MSSCRFRAARSCGWFERGRRALRLAGLALLPLLLGGCSLELMDPKGAIGQQEKSLILAALALMLLVVVPVIALTLYFAWRYRASNTRATYAPTWAHSTAIEVVVWTIPCLIVVTLGVLIWHSTHALDPYRPIQAERAPIRVDVVALNWKWLFVYPDYGVASVNELALPAHTPVAFRLTAESLMNSFFIPQLGSQVYAMAGMQTRLHLIADTPGDYAGMSAAYSGAGFSDMAFTAKVRDDAGFARWLAAAKAAPLRLDAATLAQLEAPSHGAPVQLYGGIATGVFDGIVGKYGALAPGALCASGDPAPIPQAAAAAATEN
jgi:cytochrome o ubiquinol oxidase subunit II